MTGAHYAPPAVPLEQQESTNFLAGIDAELIRVDLAGRVSLPGFHSGRWKLSEMSLFSQAAVRSGVIQLGNHREYLTQLGAGAALVLQYGWPKDQVNPADPFDWSFDLATYAEPGPNAPYVIAGEAKASMKGLLSLLAAIEGLARGGSAPEAASKGVGHANYRGLLRFRPPFFWAVGPSETLAFSATYEGESIRLRRLRDIPHFRDWSTGSAG